MNWRYKIFIIDDHAVVRAGLKQILAETVDIVITDEAEEGSEALNKIQKDHFDLVLLDISMPGRGGLDILKDIRLLRPKLPVLILSMHAEEQYALRVLRAGASGYVTKECAAEELVAAIRIVLQGRKYVSSDLAEVLIHNLDVTDRAPHEELSDREYQVLCLVGEGKTVGDIAVKLSLSAKTISTYRTRLLKKLKLKSNADMVSYAIRNRLVE